MVRARPPLLDAMRTLLAIKCSGKRDYKRYVRNNREPFAYLRGVVDNPRRPSGGLYHPFFPIVSDAVTLLCRIKKQAATGYAITPFWMVTCRWNWPRRKRNGWACGNTAAGWKWPALPRRGRGAGAGAGRYRQADRIQPQTIAGPGVPVFGDKDVLDNYSAPVTNNVPPSWNWKRSPGRKKHWKHGWKP
jgi:hypothetical protein